MRRIAAVALVIAITCPAFAERNEYQVRQENKNYEAWRDKAFGGTASNSSSSSRPSALVSSSSSRAQADYAREANNRYLQQRMKEDDAYNARVGENNRRVDALNQRYARRRSLNEQALAGNVPAMRLLAEDVLNDADATLQDKQAAWGWMAAAAARGDTAAAQHVEEVAEARRRAQAAAEKRDRDARLARANAGDIRASYLVGWPLYIESDPQLHMEGLRMLKKCVEANDLDTLEFLYRYAKRSEMGDEESDILYQVTERLAMLPGHPKEAMVAGNINLAGTYGRKIDRTAAMPFFLHAASQDYADAFIRIAEIHEKGIGGPRDLAVATEWYRKALTHEHPEFGIRKETNLLHLTRVLLDPENHPKEHREELLQLWDDNMLGKNFDTKKLALIAADALASGIIGDNDVAREMFYLSRAANDDWYANENDDRQRVCERFGSYIMAHADDAILIVVKQDKEFVIRTATKAHAAFPYGVGTIRSPNATVESCLAAGYAILAIPDQEFKDAGLVNCAVHIFHATANKFKDPIASYECGRLNLLGKGVERSAVNANEWLVDAWEKGVAKAAFLLAIIQQKKMIPDASEAAADEWIKKGALKGDPGCMRNYGLNFLAAKDDDPAQVAAQKKSGIAWLKKAGDAGNAEALTDLASAYEHGNGVALDDTTAVALFQQAAAAGSGAAKRELAARMAQGKGVPQDRKAAMKMMFEAAQTDLLAAGNLGVVLWRGDWGEKAVEDGLNWMEVALERGFWPAGRNLAKIYHLGLGVDANEEKAHAYLERAGTIGGVEAATAVAEMYAAGEIIAKDEEAAARWRSKAAALPANLQTPGVTPPG
ncbi:MAG TPA: hypothetical protein VHO24_01195 [Opitutaceae bacterium]|nr:hypothetical protein [Opitutaceae bacterium]